MLTITANRSASPTGETHARALPADIWRARSYIEEHLEEEISLAKVARFAGISPNHLSEKFKAVSGIKFVDYIAHARFERARSLLPDRHLRISEIAFEVGFQSLSQFNRVFKRLSGLSPTEYRAVECATSWQTEDASCRDQTQTNFSRKNA
ncbi:MAG: AraC family transcriptional regulator [Spartobacteria bacterium]